jgi:hypothetical protein
MFVYICNSQCINIAILGSHRCHVYTLVQIFTCLWYMSIRKVFLDKQAYESLVIETYDTIRKCVLSRKVGERHDGPKVCQSMPLGTPYYGADYSRRGSLKRGLLDQVLLEENLTFFPTRYSLPFMLYHEDTNTHLNLRSKYIKRVLDYCLITKLNKLSAWLDMIDVFYALWWFLSKCPHSSKHTNTATRISLRVSQVYQN